MPAHRKELGITITAHGDYEEIPQVVDYCKRFFQDRLVRRRADLLGLELSSLSPKEPSNSLTMTSLQGYTICA